MLSKLWIIQSNPYDLLDDSLLYDASHSKLFHTPWNMKNKVPI